MSDRVDDVINNPHMICLGVPYFSSKDVDTNYHYSTCFIGWTFTEPYISSSTTRKVVTAVITGLSLGP